MNVNPYEREGRHPSKRGPFITRKREKRKKKGRPKQGKRIPEDEHSYNLHHKFLRTKLERWVKPTRK